MNITTSTVTISSARLNVAQRGHGHGKALLLVHGFPLDHQMWQGQLAELGDEFRVIAPDLRGFGRSSEAMGTVTMQQYADDLAELLDALQVDQPVALCGLSMGGYIAWQFWRRHAARLSHLIVCDTRAAADTPEAAQTRRQTAARVLAEGTAVLVDAMLPKLFAERTQRQRSVVLAATEQVIRSAHPAGVAAALHGMAAREDATPWLPAITVPTLVICGQQDVISPVTEMEQIALAIPAAEFVVIPACGHMAPLEDPVHVNKAMRGFLHA
ncbi:MAG: alpha/beta fold hydrolase [Pirellulaceae bacterium]